MLILKVIWKQLTSDFAIEFYKLILAFCGMLICAYIGLIYIKEFLSNYNCSR